MDFTSVYPDAHVLEAWSSLTEKVGLLRGRPGGRRYLLAEGVPPSFTFFLLPGHGEMNRTLLLQSALFTKLKTMEPGDQRAPMKHERGKKKKTSPSFN